jgi:hypothetical protein
LGNYTLNEHLPLSGSAAPFGAFTQFQKNVQELRKIWEELLMPDYTGELKDFEEGKGSLSVSDAPSHADLFVTRRLKGITT